MFFKRYKFHLLFLLAYIGALVIEKPTYSGNTVQACFSYLFTVILHFCLFGLLILANNKLLIPQLLEKKLFTPYVAALLGVVMLYTFSAWHYNYFIHVVVLHDRPINSRAGFWDYFVYALCCSVITSMLYITQKWAEQEEREKNNQINHLQTELKYLRSQINPHFLFNGLNTIYGNIDMSNVAARDSMVQFSDLLRYNLYEADVDFIELVKEIKYLQNYVALQKARSNDNMQIELQTSCADQSVKVAPLIFMAFVENAFKFASRDDQHINTISIKLHQKGRQIVFECENPFDESDAPQGGIGLNNVIRRLELLYKGRYVLQIKNNAPVYQVLLTLSL